MWQFVTDHQRDSARVEPMQFEAKVPITLSGERMEDWRRIQLQTETLTPLEALKAPEL